MKWFLLVGFTVLSSLLVSRIIGQGISLPDQFENVNVLNDLTDPSAIGFSPDGRLFFSERINGDLRVAVYDSSNLIWNILATPFYHFDVPSSAHRSSGLRGFTFDPNFEVNGFVYAFYMKNNPRHNRVVRIQSDPNNPNVALGSETLLMEVPFNSSTSSGSHNGGDLVFGVDGKLYFTTGDGWNGGDNVQSLETYTGKLFRINSDGTIPNGNPFIDTAFGNLRGIYAIGLRNPYTISCVPESGNIYINDAVLSQKATVYQIRSDSSSKGANFGHDGFLNGLGTETIPWTNTGISGAKLITGGAWYPQDGYWPEEYRGSYFAAMWGSNNGNAGHIVRIASETDKTRTIFASNVLAPPRHKPVMTEIGPDGNLYYLLTDYETGDGQVHMIRFTGQAVTSAPSFNPPPNQYDDPIKVSIESLTPGADIYYTLDGSLPDEDSFLYSDSVSISNSLTIRAIAFSDSILTSSLSIGAFIIGPVPNMKPVADAGPDLIVEVNKVATLNGAATYDPDGSPLEISESWKQVDGPATTLLDEDETVANFTPSLTGTYTFRIKVEDVDGAVDSADVKITVVDSIDDDLEGLIARWSCEEGFSNQLEDTSPNSNRGYLNGAYWSMETEDSSDFSLLFDQGNDIVDIGNLDISGQSMTICFWTKVNSHSTHDARFISKANGQNDVNHLWMVSTLNGDQLRFRLNTDNGATTTLISDDNVIGLDEWIHVAVVYDGTKMYLYKNGQAIDSTNKTGNIGTDPTMNAAIGNQPADATGGARPFDGLLDEIRMYGRALSDSELQRVMLANVEKCNTLVQNGQDAGNGSLRRAIACATTGDSVRFSTEVLDTIKLNSLPIDINNDISIIGGNAETIISNSLMEPGLSINLGTEVHLNNLHFHSAIGPILYNAGFIHLQQIEISIPDLVLLPPLQNVGSATILGDVLLRR